MFRGRAFLSDQTAKKLRWENRGKVRMSDAQSRRGEGQDEVEVKSPFLEDILLRHFDRKTYASPRPGIGKFSHQEPESKH